MKTTAPKSPPLLRDHLLAVALGCLALAGLFRQSPARGQSTADGSASLPLEQTRERALDRVIHVQEEIIREIPAVPRRCDSLDARKEKVDLGDCKLYCRRGLGTPAADSRD